MEGLTDLSWATLLLLLLLFLENFCLFCRVFLFAYLLLEWQLSLLTTQYPSAVSPSAPLTSWK